jgi:CheY-like chemotaxis protein
MILPTILIADDNADDVFFLKHQLQGAKLANPLQFVSDGEKVLEYLRGEGVFADRVAHPWPLLLVLDLKMPRKTGFDVLEYLKEEGTVLPVVVVSSMGEVHQMSRAYQLGARSFLMKPLLFRQFDDTIKRIAELELRSDGASVVLQRCVPVEAEKNPAPLVTAPEWRF